MISGNTISPAACHFIQNRLTNCIASRKNSHTTWRILLLRSGFMWAIPYSYSSFPIISAKENVVMIWSKKTVKNHAGKNEACLKKYRLKTIVCALAEIGLLAASGMGSAAAEPIYYYTGNIEAATDEENWKDATGKPVTGIIVKTEGSANEYRFLSGIYDGKQTTGEVWLIGDDKDIHIVSGGPLIIQNWGMGGIPPNQGVITTSGKIVFGDNVSLLNNYSSGYNTAGGGTLYSKTGIVFGDNARLINNQAAPPISGPYYGGGAIFLAGTSDSKVIFGKNSLIENNTAYSGGAIFATGSVTFGEGATIRGNHASSQGGALNVTGALTLNSDSLVEFNEVVKEGVTTYGGAFFIKGNATITGSTFRNNKTTATGWGGAIYIQDGFLNISDGSFMEGNEAFYGGAIFANTVNIDINHTSLKNNKATNGGALFVSASTVSIQDEIKGTNPAGTIFEGNTAVTSGGAIYAQSSSTLSLGYGTRFEGNEASKGGAIYALSSTNIDLKPSLLKNNKATYAGAIYISGGSLNVQGSSRSDLTNGTVFHGNTAATSGGAIYATNANVTLGSGTQMDSNTSSYGGAIYATGSTTTLDITDTVFSNNTASQQGGAIYLKDGTLKFNVTKTSATPAVSGNTSNWGGFLFMAGNSVATFNINNGQQLHIGDASYFGPNTQMDSIYMDSTASLSKKGGGVMKINSSMDNLWGKVSVEEGTLSIAQHWDIKNTVSVTGGTLDTSSFSFTGDNAKLTVAGGTLITDTGHVFENSLGTDGTNKETGNVNGHLDFSSGTITFRDEKYNLDYALLAAEKLNITPSREITFTGKLSDSSSSHLTVDDLNGKNISNMVLGGVTITTGTDPAGKDLVIGSADGSQFGGADAIAGSIGGSSLNLGTDGSAVTVTGGQYLTLLGGETNTSLIEAGSDGKKAVDVAIGTAGGGAASAGTLNLGTAGLASSSTLTGNVQISDSSTLNVRAGEHSITGESGSATGPVAGINNNGGKLNVDEQATLQTSVKQTTGETNVIGKLASSSVELEGGDFKVSGTAQIGQLTQKDGNTAISGTVQSNSLEVAGGTMSVTGTLKTDNLVVSNGMSIAVGDGNAAGKLSSSSTSLNGGGIFLDPVWLGNDTIETASHGALVFNNQTVDGQLAVGRNSLLVLGQTSVDRSIKMFNTSGLKWGKDDISAALSINAPQQLSATQGSIMVDGSLTSAPSALAPNSATFANGSLLIVDASSLNGKAALSSDTNGTLSVSEKASLLIGNATAGNYVITTGFTDNTNVKGWEGDYLSSSDQLIGLTIDKSELGTIKVEARALDVTSTLPGIVMPGIISEIWFGGSNNTDSTNAGIAFLSRSMDNRYLAPDDTVRTINGAAQIAIAAGVQASAIQASDSVNRALQDHLSLSSNTGQNGAPSLHREGPDLWASMLYRDSDSSGIRAGRFNADYKNDFGGIITGADYTWKDTGNGSFRAGGALNIGKGEGKSRGDFNDTRNDYDTYGLSAYGSWNSGNANLMVDIGYLKGKNELKQTVSSALGGTLKADVDTQVWTIGTQGEYRLKTASFDITPHIGVRWLRLKTDAFNTHNTQGTVFQTDSDTQNIWQIPVGVTVSRDYVAKNGWTVKPKLDISFIPATGDRNASTRIHVPGVAASDMTRTEIMDSTSWNGSLGLEMQKDRLSIGLSAAYQKSSNEKSHGFMLKINRQFD